MRINGRQVPAIYGVRLVQWSAYYVGDCGPFASKMVLNDCVSAHIIHREHLGEIYLQASNDRKLIIEF